MFRFLVSSLLLILIYGTQYATSNCCLRQEPFQALTDGLELQYKFITSNREEFSFMPGKLADLSTHNTATEILRLIKQRANLMRLHDTPIVAAVKRIINGVIKDACAYLVQDLEIQIDCDQTSEVQSLYNKLEFFRKFKMTQKAMDNIDVPSDRGTPKNRYAYWKENLRDSYSESQAKSIEKILRFVPLANECICE